MSRYAVYEVWEDSVPESFVYDGRLAGVLVGIAAENPLGPRPDDMHDIEHVHECVGSWTGDGVRQVSPGDPIVRCKYCAHMSKYQLVGGGCICSYFGFPLPDPDGFCAWGEAEEDER